MQLTVVHKRVLSIVATLVIMLFTAFIVQGLESGGHKQKQEELSLLKFFLFDQPRTISGIPLSNLAGESKPFDQHLDGWRLVNFGYMYCPDICPINLSLLSDVKKQWDSEYQSAGSPVLNVLHVTFDPVRDTKELLGQYLNYMNPAFYGLTGDIPDIRRLAQRLNMVFIHEKPDADGNYFITHSDSMALINPEGQYVGMFKGPYQQDAMMKALEVLMN